MNQPNRHELVRQVVESGAVSGIYYILISDLPSEMTLCDLKTLSRKVASVDKCFINPKTCEAWVRVRSQHDFLKVYNHLNGHLFKGYTLSASDENGTSCTYIWDQKKSRSAANPSSSSRGAGTLAISPHTGSHSSDANAPRGLEYGYYAPANGNSSPPTEYNAYYSYDSGYSSGASSSGYQYPTEHSAHTVTAMAPNFTSPQQYESDGSAGPWYPPYSPGGYDHGYGYSQADYTEEPQTAKVVVKNLSRHARPKELESYLLTAAGGRHMLQEDVRFPRHSSSSSGRQHAFLMFKTYNDALAAVNKLDKTKLLGLVIEARFVTEMVLPIRGSSSSLAPQVPFVPSAGINDSSIDLAAATTTAASDCGAGDGSTPSGFKEDPKSKRDNSHNLVVDGKSIYGHVKKAVEETKNRDHKHKHNK